MTDSGNDTDAYNPNEWAVVQHSRRRRAGARPISPSTPSTPGQGMTSAPTSPRTPPTPQTPMSLRLYLEDGSPNEAEWPSLMPPTRGPVETTECEKNPALAARRRLVAQTPEDDSELEVTFSALSPPSPSQLEDTVPISPPATSDAPLPAVGG